MKINDQATVLTNMVARVQTGPFSFTMAPIKAGTVVTVIQPRPPMHIGYVMVKAEGVEGQIIVSPDKLEIK